MLYLSKGINLSLKTEHLPTARTNLSRENLKPGRKVVKLVRTDSVPGKGRKVSTRMTFSSESCAMRPMPIAGTPAAQGIQSIQSGEKKTTNIHKWPVSAEMNFILDEKRCGTFGREGSFKSACKTSRTNAHSRKGGNYRCL